MITAMACSQQRIEVLPLPANYSPLTLALRKWQGNLASYLDFSYEYH